MYVIHAVTRGETRARSFPITLVEGHNDLFHLLDNYRPALTANIWVVPIPGFFDLID